MIKKLILVLVFSIGIIMIAGCSINSIKQLFVKATPTVAPTPTVAAKSPADLSKEAKNTFGVLPDKMPGSEKDTPAMIKLGEKLYFEKGLSVNNTESCNTCHLIDKKRAGVDNLPTSPGAHKNKGDRNSPTVLNAGYQFAQFWDGRAANLEEQAKGPILNPVEMGMKSDKDVVAKISKIKGYKELFKKAFPKDKKITYNNIAKAIAAFERTLKTNDPFNEFMKGKADAITADEIKGYEMFVSSGCVSCHNGPLLGGNSYQKMGVVKPYASKDPGRYKVTKKEGDKYFFKVPMLRNVALTKPYFHDGKVATLQEAVKQMAILELGKELKDEEIQSIMKFLNTLSDKNRI